MCGKASCQLCGSSPGGCDILYLWSCEWQPGKAERSISFLQPRAVSHPGRCHMSKTDTHKHLHRWLNPHHRQTTTATFSVMPPFHQGCFLPDRSVKLCQTLDDQVCLNFTKAEIESQGCGVRTAMVLLYPLTHTQPRNKKRIWCGNGRHGSRLAWLPSWHFIFSTSAAFPNIFLWSLFALWVFCASVRPCWSSDRAHESLCSHEYCTT